MGWVCFYFSFHTLRLINISYLYATLVYETVIKSAYWHIPGEGRTWSVLVLEATLQTVS